MRRTAAILAAVLCLSFAGCSNEFAQEEYDSDEKIVQQGDQYAKSLSASTWSNNELSFSAGKFDGRETLWSETVIQECEVEISVSMSLETGTAKLVYIAPDDNITELIESSYGSDFTRTITMPEGKNRIKLVGYDCEELELDIEFAY